MAYPPCTAPVSTNVSRQIYMVIFHQGIPVATSAEAFGLHANSGIDRDSRSALQLFDSFLSVVEPSGDGGADGPGATESLSIAIASGVLARLPDAFDVEAAVKRYPTAHAESMNTVLVQEMERFNALLRVIRKSLLDSIKAIKGAIVMTPELEAVALSLSAGECPASWSNFSYPSLKSLGGYVTDFIGRLRFFQVSRVTYVSLERP